MLLLRSLLIRRLLLVWLLIEWQLKKKTLIGETGCLSNFLGHFSVRSTLHPSFSNPPALSSTPNYLWLTIFLDCPDIQFLIQPFPNTVSKATFGYLPLTAQRLSDLRNAMPCQWSPTMRFPPKPYIGNHSISLGMTSILSIFLCSRTWFTSHR